MLITNNEREISKYILKYLTSKGCQQARISFSKGIANFFEFRNHSLERLESNTENRIYLEIFVNNKFGAFSSNRLNRNELEIFASNAIDAVKLLEEDNYRQLPNPERYFSGKDNLDLFDDKYLSITTQEKFDVIKSSLAEIETDTPDLVSILGSFDDSLNSLYMIDSNGFEQEKNTTSYSLVSNIILDTKSEAKVDGSNYDMNCNWTQLVKTGLTKEAYSRAKEKQDQQKIVSDKYDLITDNRSSGKFMNPILSAMNGASLDQKRSFLVDKIGEQIFSEKLTLYDYPHQRGKLGSRMFDGEGVATEDRIVIEKGILKTYYLNTYYSNKMNLTPTISSPSGLCLEMGNHSLSEIIQKANNAIYVTGYNGGNTNPTTGDFSFGIEGFLIQNGKITKAINEMNITGNLVDLWCNLHEVGNDPRNSTANRIPALWFKDITFSGL